MTKFIILILLCLRCIHINSQSWQWAKIEAASFEEGSVCNDLKGNVYLAGGVNVGPTAVIGTYTINTPGLHTCLVKYDSNGNVLWVQSFQSGTSYATGVYTDNADNVFITGVFGGTIVVGTQTLASNGVVSDIFLIKYDSAGNVLWAQKAGGTSVDYSWSVCTDGFGNSFITGTFRSPSIVFGTYTLTNTSVSNYFLVKYDVNGNVLWAQSNQSGETDSKYVSVDINGNVYICGYFINSVTIGPSSIMGFGSADYFLAKYSSTGNVLWVTTGGSINDDIANCVNVDPYGEVYVTGSYTFAPISIGTNTFSNSGGQDMFLAKYGTNGNLLWAKTAGGTGSDIGYSLASYVGGVYVASKLGSTSLTIGTTVLTTTTVFDAMFIAQYDAAGNPIYANSLTGGGDDNMAICLDNNCNLYLGGDLWNSPTVVGNNTLVTPFGSSTEVLFIAKFNTGQTSPTTSISGGSYTICAGNSCTLNASGAASFIWFNGTNNNSVVVSPIVTSNYFVLGMPSHGCVFKAVQNVIVNPLPLMSVTAGNTIICTGESITLVASGANTYTWSNGINSPTNVVTPTVSSVYSVNATNTVTGCAATASLFLSVSGCDALSEENDLKALIKIYPNPSNGSFILILPSSINNAELVLISPFGEIIYNHKVLEENNALNCDNLNKGIYFLSLFQNKKLVFKQKLIID